LINLRGDNYDGRLSDNYDDRRSDPEAHLLGVSDRAAASGGIGTTIEHNNDRF
jgi:hypothetical protein